jgi:glycosyltransferase involved in cell wall biosynthesis
MAVVVINAISVKEGGPLVVLNRLLSGMVGARPDWDWHVVVNSRARVDAVSPRLSYLRFPRHDASGWKTRLWYETGLPALAANAGADVLFSMTNYLPTRPVGCRTALLLQHAGHFSGVFTKLTEARLGAAGRISWRLKGRWVRSSLRRADAVTVQTEALAARVIEALSLPASAIQVIPHGPGLAGRRADTDVATVPDPSQPFRVGYITKHGVQKNFAVVFAAVARLAAAGLRPMLVLTLDPAAPENRAILDQARHLGVETVIENHGEVDSKSVGELYRSLHAFVFASLCESFGFPLVEAMAHGIPLVVADTDSNVEVAAGGAQRFAADDAAELARALERLARDPQWHRSCSQASLRRGRDFSWEAAASRTVEMIEALAARPVRGVAGPP